MATMLTIAGYGTRFLNEQTTEILHAHAAEQQRKMWEAHGDDLVGVPEVKTYSANTVNDLLVPWMVTENRKPQP